MQHDKQRVEKEVQLKKLPPLQNRIVDKTIENVTRKLVAGYRNRDKNPPKGTSPGSKAAATNILKKSSAQSAIDVANRGQMWKEIVSKSFSHGITSLANLKFDSEFKVTDGKAEGLKHISKGPGVYVIYDTNGEVRYVGDAKNIQS